MKTNEKYKLQVQLLHAQVQRLLINEIPGYAGSQTPYLLPGTPGVNASNSYMLNVNRCL